MFDEIIQSFKKGSALNRLIFINVGVFLTLYILKALLLLAGYLDTLEFMQNNFAIKANLNHILRKPWTLITFMFLHLNFKHLIYNLILIYFSGKIFQDYLGEKKLLATYFLGGFFGALLLILSYNFSPVLGEYKSSPAYGASASAMAILIAISTYTPNLKVFIPLIGRISIKYIAIAFILIDIINFDDKNIGGHIGHIGGALWGYIYIRKLKQGQDIAEWFYSIMDAITYAFSRKNLEKLRKNNLKTHRKTRKT